MSEPLNHRVTYCHECEQVDYPCPTVRLLDRIDAEMGVQR